MEQKKIFWIVIAVSVFLLVIFGTAIVLYWPSRSTGASLQQAAVIAPAGNQQLAGDPSGAQSQIDPDSWVREPATAPDFGSNIAPAPGNINLTIVNGDNAGANFGTMDVSGLTKAPAPVETADAVKNAVDPSTQTTVTSKAGDAGTIISKTTTVKTETTVQAAAKPAPVKAAAAVAEKPAPKKTVTVTEYWIQTGSFSNKLNAEKARETLTARYLKAEIFTKEASGATSYRVRVGPYKSKTEADYWLGTVKEIPDFSGSYVSEVKTKK